MFGFLTVAPRCSGRLNGYSLPGIRTLGAAFDAVPDRTSLTTDGVPLAATFDAASRPTSGGYGADPDGRGTARPGQTLAYDSLGRLAEVRTNPGNVLLARYGYDALDRLHTIERPGQPTLRVRYAGITTAAAQLVDHASGSVVRHVTVGPEGTVQGLRCHRERGHRHDLSRGPRPTPRHDQRDG